MRTATTYSPRRSRLAFWVGAAYLLLFLMGPWAHEHASHEDTSRTHHVHGFVASSADHAGAAQGTAVSLPQHGTVDTGADHKQTVDVTDDLAHAALQADLSAMLPGSVRVQPAQGVALIRIVAPSSPVSTIRIDWRAVPTRPTSSGQLALHQGTDVSPPGV